MNINKLGLNRLYETATNTVLAKLVNSDDIKLIERNKNND